MRIPRDTVLVVIDVQDAIDDPVWGPRNNPQAEANIAALLAAWRKGGLPIIHIRHDSVEPDSPYRPGQAGNEFKAQARPLAEEIIVAKQTNSAFIGTGLEDMLSGAGHTTLVVCGALTNNSVEASVRHAGNLGFRVLVVSDACWAVDKASPDGVHFPAELVHQMSLANINVEYAGVVETATAVAAAGLWPGRARQVTASGQ